MPNSNSQRRYAATFLIFMLVIAAGVFNAISVGAAGGDLDMSFDTGAGTNGSVRGVAVQPDGKVLIIGSFSTVNGVARSGIARLNADGSLDTSFNVIPNSSVYSIAVQPDGKILIGGQFDRVNGVWSIYFSRLNPDGSLDTSFVGRAVTAVYCIVVQADGKLAVCSARSSRGGGVYSYVQRLNADGSADTSFQIAEAEASGSSGIIFDIAVQPDGKVIVGGGFYRISRENRNGLARLNSDGSFDTSFSPGTNAYHVLGIVVQPDGKILIGGSFRFTDGNVRNGIARLDPDGKIDSTFNISTSGGVRTLARQPDGKIVIGGSFTTINNVPRGKIALLNPDGSLDSSFNASVSGDGAVNDLALQPDGKVVIGGQFTAVNGVARMNIARLLGTGVTLAPVADACVQGADAYRDTNFGASPEMQVKRTLNTGAGRGRRGFLRFNTSNVEGAISSAKLRIYARLTDASLPPTNMIVQKVTDTLWDELSLTWNNKPVVESSTALAQITVTSATGQYYEFDLTAFIQAERAAGRMAVSFRLINAQPTGNSGASFTSVNTKEAAINHPQLVIQN